ncbi:MAG: hypothetical protein AAGA69_07505 [Pseudomonadota bacterium]
MAVPKDKPNRRFIFWSTGLLLAGVLIFIAITRMQVFAESAHAVFAIILGVGFTIALSVGLMALTFYSDRSGHDEDVGE